MAGKPFQFKPTALATALTKPWHRDAFIDASHRIANLGYCEWDYTKGCIISCTPYYAEIFGMSIDEVIESQNSWDKVLEQLHPDDRQRYAESHEQHLSQGTHEIEYRVYRKDGELRHIKEVGIVFFDDLGNSVESMGLLQDITAQIERLQDLENRDAMARQVENITAIGHFIWDIHAQRYRYISPGYAQILGEDPDSRKFKMETLDGYLADIHDDDRQRVFENYRDRFRDAEGMVIEYRIRYSEDSYRWIREKSITVRDAAKDTDQVIGVIQDITQQKKIEENLYAAKNTLEAEVESRTRKLSETVDRLNREIAEREVISSELEVKNAELERYTYTVSHDLKSPLVTIRGFLGLLERDIKANDSKRIEGDIEQLKSATDTMGVLLSDLLELSRLGSIIGEQVTCDLSDLVVRAIELAQSEIHERGIEVIIEDMPRVHVDETRVVEVLLNLIENSIKFMGDQESPFIHIGAVFMDEMICCSVRDNGIGISRQYQLQVFELFERLDAQVDGTGVGLAVVKRIVEIHGGKIWVESDGPGTGCTISFTLPRG